MTGKLKLRGYAFAYVFQPQLLLKPETGYKFAEAIRFPAALVPEGRTWLFVRDESNPHFPGKQRVAVDPDRLQFDATLPEIAWETHETLHETVLVEFQRLFELRHLIRSAARISGQLALGSDARTFLAGKLMSLNHKVIAPIGRPVQVLGLHFACPAVRRGDEVLDSVLDVKIESLADDNNQLYLEVETQWIAPIAWNPSKSPQDMIRRAAVVKDYLEQNVLQVLSLASESNNTGEA